MLSSPDLSFSRTLPTYLFNQLGNLLEQMTQATEGEVLLMTEAVLDRVPISSEWRIQRFTVVVSQGFSALLVGKPMEEVTGGLLGSEEQLEKVYGLVGSLGNGESDRALNVSLTFDLNAIASFLLELRNLFACDSQIYLDLQSYSQKLVPNNSTLQEKFTLLLLESLIDQSQETIVTKSSLSNVNYSACQQVEEALRKQIAQERLLNRVTTQIRNSLDLSVIVETAISQVREFLELDRLVVYKFEKYQVGKDKFAVSQVNNQEHLTINSYDYSDSNKIFNLENSQIIEAPQQQSIKYIGCIIYENLKNETIPSVLNYREKNCFAPSTKCWEKYCQGFTLAINDIEKHTLWKSVY